MELSLVKRPRNIGWPRAAALLYGDWGTSKAYVVGIGFALAGYMALPHLLAVTLLTAIVGVNYIWICKYFPNGGGVYSSARVHSRRLAVVGALLLSADYVVTASLSCLEAFHYFGFSHEGALRSAILAIVVIGIVNTFGPKFTGKIAIYFAVPTVVLVIILLVAGIPHITLEHVQPVQGSLWHNWTLFVGMILALSGVEAAANTTGVMKLDPGSTEERPVVLQTARKAIVIVAIEVCVATALISLLALSIPGVDTREHQADMLKFLGSHYVAPWFGSAIGIVIALLLLSAVNTAINGFVSVLYVMSHDGELPPQFTQLNGFGVPWLALILATALPVLVLDVAGDLDTLASLYAIGVVGAITINLFSCGVNRELPMKLWERSLMLLTAVLLGLVGITIALTKWKAAVFVIIFLVAGFTARSFAQKMKLRQPTAPAVPAPPVPDFTPDPELMGSAVSSILVCARGVTPALRFAIEEARIRKARLYVLYIMEVFARVEVKQRWQDDPDAVRIFTEVKTIAEGVPVIPLYAQSYEPADTILDMSATLGVDLLIIGGSGRNSLVRILKGNVIEEVARNLPDNIRMLIYS